MHCTLVYGVSGAVRCGRALSLCTQLRIMKRLKPTTHEVCTSAQMTLHVGRTVPSHVSNSTSVNYASRRPTAQRRPTKGPIGP